MKNKKNIKILIADSQFLIREGLKNLISRNNEMLCFGEAINYESLLVSLTFALPDLLIIGYCDKNCFTAEQIKEVKELYNELNILVISSETNSNSIKSILKFGIKNYLLIESNEKEIIEAIEACVAKKSYYSSNVFELVLNIDSSETNDYYKTLTNREQEIIKLTLSGLRTKELAEKLFLSPYTVSTHKKNIFKKLGIKNSLELNKFYIAKNIPKN